MQGTHILGMIFTLVIGSIMATMLVGGFGAMANKAEEIEKATVTIGVTEEHGKEVVTKLSENAELVAQLKEELEK